MNIEKMREEFEERNGHRAWFVSGGRKDSGPEGYVYDDFTTDMCWTCWVDSRESLVIDLPIPKETCGPDGSYMEYFEPEQIERTIEAAGLKVKS